MVSQAHVPWILVQHMLDYTTIEEPAKCYFIRKIPETVRNRLETVPETVGIRTGTVETVDIIRRSKRSYILLIEHLRFLRFLCEYQQFLGRFLNGFQRFLGFPKGKQQTVGVTQRDGAQ